MDIKDQVVIVTGSGQGIGRGIAWEYAKREAIVIIAELQEQLGLALEQELLSAGYRAKFVQTDVTNVTQIEQLVAQVIEEFGKIDTLVNNAGITIFKSIFDCTIEDWDKMMNTDLRSVFLLSKAVGKEMVKKNNGVIINIASNHVLATLPNTEMYAAAKSGVIGFTKSLALSLGDKGIRVNAISPGFMDTHHHRTWLTQFEQPDVVQAHINGLHATRRIGNPEEVGNMCVFLSSSLAKQVTGANIVMDGGLSTRLYTSQYE
ncbi:short-chain dehydrogenase [Solibacillus sp. R5-41]|uniref:SDR family NAD(P)-dependent oxidoreductase n=1 Tax=Solibacillus sp. R5-41 TaxID=2048654 RepID=UPI000C1274DA|nr:SDR family oxidoreductase [Solibacillus sp. R5-41]ATP40414.1 short-chain dehydrogenase [Solibacillus sp. R5-41]